MSQGFETTEQRAARRRKNRPNQSPFEFANMPTPTLSKNAIRRGQYTYAIRQNLKRIEGRYRFDIGRFLDRSKYNGDGSRK
jgi:hypothetical protein